jgi:hypothetical protein
MIITLRTAQEHLEAFEVFSVNVSYSKSPDFAIAAVSTYSARRLRIVQLRPSAEVMQLRAAAIAIRCTMVNKAVRKDRLHLLVLAGIFSARLHALPIEAEPLWVPKYGEKAHYRVPADR